MPIAYSDIIDELAKRNAVAPDTPVSTDEPFARTLLAEILRHRPDEVDDVAVPAAVLRPRHRLRRALPTTISIGALAAAVALVVALVPGSPVRPTPAAAALDAAAASAASQTAVTLAPGQYLYSQVTTNDSGGCLLDARRPGTQDYVGLICTTYQTTRQDWQAADGSGREVDNYVGPVGFMTPSSQANWAAAGSPSQVVLLPGSNDPNATTSLTATDYPAPTGSDAQFNASIPGIRPADLSTLPTDPSALLSFLQNQVTKNGPLANTPNEITAYQGGPNATALSLDERVFSAAMWLLTEPSIGTTPQLRSALYNVMAGLPGIESLGTTQDRDGRSGTGIAGPVSSGLRYEIVINPTTDAILQIEQVVADPSAESSLTTTYSGSQQGQVLVWADYSGNTVVGSETATS